MFPWRRHVVSGESAMTAVSSNGSFRPSEPAPTTDGKGINRDDCFTESRLITTRPRSPVVYVALATLMAPFNSDAITPKRRRRQQLQISQRRVLSRRNRARRIDRKKEESFFYSCHSPPVNIVSYTIHEAFHEVCQESRRYVAWRTGTINWRVKAAPAAAAAAATEFQMQMNTY